MKAVAVVAAAEAAAGAGVDAEAGVEDAVVAEVNSIKNKLMKSKNAMFIHLPAMAGYLLLPCLYGGLFLSGYFPFHLAGKQFLVWYLVHMASGHLLLFLAARYSSVKINKLSGIFVWMTLIISVSRMCQGLYHHKPILYLCLLTGLNILLLLLWKRNKMDA